MIDLKRGEWVTQARASNWNNQAKKEKPFGDVQSVLSMNVRGQGVP